MGSAFWNFWRKCHDTDLGKRLIPVAARIINQLMPEEDGILFDTVAEAETALAHMIADYKRRGYTVTPADGDVDSERMYSVVDEGRRPFGIYRIEV